MCDHRGLGTLEYHSKRLDIYNNVELRARLGEKDAGYRNRVRGTSESRQVSKTLALNT